MSLHDYCNHYHAHILVGNKITGLHDRVINILVILRMIHTYFRLHCIRFSEQYWTRVLKRQ